MMSRCGYAISACIRRMKKMKGHPKDELMLWLCIVCAVLLFLSMAEMAHTHDHTSECIQYMCVSVSCASIVVGLLY